MPFVSDERRASAGNAAAWPALPATGTPLPSQPDRADSSTPRHAPLAVNGRHVPAATVLPPAKARGAATGNAPPQSDDLTRISGIDRDLAARLGQAGITTFFDIAAWTRVDVARISAALGLGQTINDGNWIEQAALLCCGSDRVAHTVTSALPGYPAGLISQTQPESHDVAVMAPTPPAADLVSRAAVAILAALKTAPTEPLPASPPPDVVSPGLERESSGAVPPKRIILIEAIGERPFINGQRASRGKTPARTQSSRPAPQDDTFECPWDMDDRFTPDGSEANVAIVPRQPTACTGAKSLSPANGSQQCPGTPVDPMRARRVTNSERSQDWDEVQLDRFSGDEAAVEIVPAGRQRQLPSAVPGSSSGTNGMASPAVGRFLAALKGR